jgi:hypothetical protein
MKLAALLVFTNLVVWAQEDLSNQLLTIKRVYVDKLTGGETAAQMRDLLIGSLQGVKLFILTENQERADMILHGAAEDLIFTDAFSSSEAPGREPARAITGRGRDTIRAAAAR